MSVKKIRIIISAAVLAVAVCLAATGYAGTTIQGSVWAGATAFPNNLSTTPPAGIPTATFSITNPGGNVFDFYSGTDDDLTSFFTNNGTNGNVVTYLTGADQNNVTQGCTVGAGNTCGINNDVMEFTGQTYMTNGETYSVTKDDAAYLLINGISVLQADSVSDTAAEADSFTWTGATGTYNFDLLYQEVNGAPAVLDADITETPEPNSFVLMGAGLLVAAFVVRSRAHA
jgi:hypothetical protein